MNDKPDISEVSTFNKTKLKKTEKYFTLKRNNRTKKKLHKVKKINRICILYFVKKIVNFIIGQIHQVEGLASG